MSMPSSCSQSGVCGGQTFNMFAIQSFLDLVEEFTEHSSVNYGQEFDIGGQVCVCVCVCVCERERERKRGREREGGRGRGKEKERALFELRLGR